MSAIAAAPDNGTATWAPMTREQREQFDADGYLVLKVRIEVTTGAAADSGADSGAGWNHAGAAPADA